MPTEPWGQGQTTLGRGKGGRPIGGRSPNGAHEEGEQDMEDKCSPNAMGHILFPQLFEICIFQLLKYKIAEVKCAFTCKT